MSARIQILPQQLACQIAAGEVIERPASVVKELVENSLDAGATRIRIDIEAAGSRLIRVRDNGAGIHADDIALALTPHSTSKIRTVEDLAAITSLGFRGEALASIAACARLCVRSGQSSAPAREIVAEPGAPLPAVAPVAHPAGTTIEVRDLFFNVPARRKFLRSEQTEFLHILELVKALSLARPDLGIKLAHNDRVVFSITAAADIADRVAAVFGRSFPDNACVVDADDRGLQLSGIVGSPETARSQADRQYLFLNGRLIRDRRLNHALRLAYRDRLTPGRYPPLLLYLHMDADAYDVNVHPTKHEVRFRAARDVHDFIFSAVSRAVAVGPKPFERWRTSSRPALISTSKDSVAMAVSEPSAPIWRHTAAAASSSDKDGYLHRVGRFLLSRDHGRLLVTDICQAIARLTRFELHQALQHGELGERPLLLPQTQALQQNLATLLERWQPRLAQLGIRLELTTPDRAALRALPKLLPAVAPTLLAQLLAWLAVAPTSGWQDELIQLLADSAAQEYEQVLAAQSPVQLLGRIDRAAAEEGLSVAGLRRELDAPALADWLSA